MIGLIADLLDAGRIETGTLSVSPSPRRSAPWWTRPATPSSPAAPDTPS